MTERAREQLGLFLDVFAVAIAAMLVRGGGRRPGWRDLAGRLSGAAIGAFVLAAALLLPFVSVWGDLWNQVVAGHLTNVARIEAAVGGVPTSEIQHEAPLLALGALGLAAAARLRPREAILLATLAVPPVAFLLISRPIFPHHLVLAAMPLTVCAAPLAAAAPRPWSSVRLFGMGAAAATVTTLLVVSLSVTPAPLQIANNTAAAIDRVVPASSLAITDDQYTTALADRSTPAQLVDTSAARILSGLLSSATVERIATRDHVDAVIFASSRLARLPGLHDWVAHRFPHAESLPDGSVMYIR